ncbi:MAG: type II toxin-antitoxin system RelE/ParE family toxin [bacterium]
MAPYKVLFDQDVERDFRKIPQQYARRIIKSILILANTPRPPQCTKIEGTHSTYRLRVGDYRAIYQVDDKNRIVTIYRVRHRKDVYRSM